MVEVIRTIEIRFTSECGEMTAQAIAASLLAAVEGRLTEEGVVGRVDDYDVRIRQPERSAS